MDTKQRAAALRAMRAWSGLDQRAASTGASLSERTLLEAEQARACSDRTWQKLAAFYATHGLHWRDGDAGELGRLLVLTIVATGE